MSSGSVTSYLLLALLLILPLLTLYLVYAYPQFFSFFQGTQITGFSQITVSSASVNSTTLSITLRNGIVFPVQVQNITVYSNNTLYSKFSCYGNLYVISGSELFQCYIKGTFNPGNLYARVNISYEISNQPAETRISSGIITVSSPLFKI